MDRGKFKPPIPDDLRGGYTPAGGVNTPGGLPTVASQTVSETKTPRVVLVARNSHSGALGEVALSGNNEDDEREVRSGLIKTDTYNSVYDPSTKTWSRQRGNCALQLRAIVEASASHNLADAVNVNGRGAHFMLNITAGAAAGNELTMTIQGKDQFTNTYYTILASAALAANGAYVLRVYPGLTATANLVANDVLPKHFRVAFTHAGANPVSYSLTANLIV